MDWLLRDLRFGVRNLIKDRRFALLAILALALGIGATTVIFSAIDSILLEPFAYKDSGRLARFFIHDAKQPHQNGRGQLSVPEFMDFREQNHVFEDVMGTSDLDILYTNSEGTQFFSGALVTANACELLGLRPILGRWIMSEDGKADAAPVFVMSYRLWTKQFNQDPKIVGTTMTLNGVSRTLVGIMPPRFLLGNDDIWIPIAWSHTDINNSETGNFRVFMWGLGRLKPGVSLQAAAADLDVIAQHLSKIYPKDYPEHFSVVTTSLADSVVGQFKSGLYMLMSAVALLLLIACCNVANLLLARATVREREIAIRASMGASRARLVRQLLVESFLLAAGGCIAGCLLAYGGLKAVVAYVPPRVVPAEAVIALKPAALWFALGVTVVTTFLCGLAPAIHAVHGDLYSRLTGTGKGAGGSFRHGKLRAGLVIFEVSLSILLLVGAGLMMRSLLALTRVELGFEPKNILFARLALPPGRYDTADQKRLLMQRVLERLNALPGVISATETISLPPYGGPQSEVTVPGETHSETWNVQFELCSEGYFRTLGAHLIRGRLLSDDDVNSVRQEIVVNQVLARKFFKDEDPIGKTVKFNVFDQLPDAPHDAYFQIIGVVGDVKNNTLRDPTLPEAYMPYTITGVGRARAIMVKTAVDPLSLLANVSKEIWAVDSSIALTQTGTVESYLQNFSYAAPEFGLAALGIFAGIGLVLVIIGVFSVMAYTVSLQTHEFGIRMALGAQQGDILKMVLLKGLRLIGAGVVVGLLASVGLMRLIASQIWGVSATDPLTFAAVVAAILAVGLAACLLPARRATQVDPLIALRYE
jgi:putative ABC transport system permease protein